MEYAALDQRSGIYGLLARCRSFDNGIWLADNFKQAFLSTIVRNKTFSVIMTRINSKKHVIKEQIQTFTVV